MNNHAFLVIASLSGTSRSANGVITPSVNKYRGPLSTTEEVEKAVLELWKETEWFLIFSRDKWVSLQNSNFVPDKDTYSSKESVAQRIKKLLNEGAVGIWVGGGKSGGNTVGLQSAKEV